MINVTTFSELAKKITASPIHNRQRLIAIDGGGGAGKTTFAACLQREIPGSVVVKIDDFYRPPQLRVPLESTKIINPNFDWDRLLTLVLEAVKNNKDISYQLYDFDKGTLSNEVIRIPKDATIIIEGVWSMQQAYTQYYDYCIWLEAPDTLRLERGVFRDGEHMRQIWEEEWIPIDEHYRMMQNPQLRADCIVDSSASDFKKDTVGL